MQDTIVTSTTSGVTSTTSGTTQTKTTTSAASSQWGLYSVQEIEALKKVTEAEGLPYTKQIAEKYLTHAETMQQTLEKQKKQQVTEPLELPIDEAPSSGLQTEESAAVTCAEIIAKAASKQKDEKVTLQQVYDYAVQHNTIFINQNTNWKDLIFHAFEMAESIQTSAKETKTKKIMGDRTTNEEEDVFR